MFFLRKSRRAQRAENFEAISYTLKKYIRLLRSELEPSHTRLKRYPAIENWGVTEKLNHFFKFQIDVLRWRSRDPRLTKHIMWCLTICRSITPQSVIAGYRFKRV